MNNELDDVCSALAARTPWKSRVDPGGAEAGPAFDELMPRSLLSIDVPVTSWTERRNSSSGPAGTGGRCQRRTT